MRKRIIPPVKCRLAEAERKNGRLRAALAEILTEIPGGKVAGWYGECFEAIREIVDVALKDEQASP